MTAALPPYNADAMLTKIRRAVWDAIDNWQPLRDWEANTNTRILRHRMEDDLDEILSDDSSFFELPSITVRPGSVSQDWYVHRMSQFSEQITIDLKTQYLADAEELSELIWQAIWQCSPPDNLSMPYTRLVTGKFPKGLSIQRAVGQVGKSKAWLFSMTFGFESYQDVLNTHIEAREAR